MPAASGRGAFVDITPVLDQRDHCAERKGWQRPDPSRSFRLSHWDFDERQIDGWDHDVGAEQLRTATATDETSLLELITE